MARKLKGVFDIEDLKKVCLANRVCPYVVGVVLVEG